MLKKLRVTIGHFEFITFKPTSRTYHVRAFHVRARALRHELERTQLLVICQHLGIESALYQTRTERL